jgi:hypothetical protein
MRRRLEQFEATARAVMQSHPVAALALSPLIDAMRELLAEVVQEVEELRAQVQTHEEEKHG